MEDTWSFVLSNMTCGLLTAANFSTELRKDCLSCSDVAGPQTDPVTNCVGKCLTISAVNVTNGQTDKHGDYRNSRCACIPKG